MAEEGARMAFCGRRSESGRALESYCLARGLQVKYIEADVTDLSSNKMLIDEIVKTYGRIDILVPNAGGGSENKMLDTMPNGQWLHDMAIYIHSPMLLSKYTIRYIIKQGVRRINNNDELGVPLQVVFSARRYASGKDANWHLAKQMSLGYCRYNIRANCVLPSATKTKMFSKNPSIAAMVAARTNSKKLMNLKM